MKQIPIVERLERNEYLFSKPRQLEPSLLAALDEAVRHFRAEARAYRLPNHAIGHRRHLDRSVRRSIAASMDDYARLIEEHAAALRTHATSMREGE